MQSVEPRGRLALDVDDDGEFAERIWPRVVLDPLSRTPVLALPSPQHRREAGHEVDAVERPGALELVADDGALDLDIHPPVLPPQERVRPQHLRGAGRQATHDGVDGLTAVYALRQIVVRRAGSRPVALLRRGHRISDDAVQLVLVG